MRRALLIWTAWAVLSPAAAWAQGWVEQILPERAFDAGSVAKGSKVRHTFRLVNRLDQEVQIETYKPKCGCTKVKIGANVIPPGTQTTIEAVIDTANFNGFKPSGLTLVFSRPTYAEVDLNFSCFIRTDVVLNPGVVDFGIVTRSAETKPTVTLNLTYAGVNPNWGITRMQTQSPRVSAKLQEQSRSGGGQVQYLLTATLDPSEVTGSLKDQITLYTNDPSAQTIPVAVSATVQTNVKVSPSSLVLGQVKAGQVVKKTLLVRSSQPFKVTNLKPSKDDVTATPATEGSLPLHTVNLSFKAPAEPGPYNAVIEIATDLKDEPPSKVTAFATIIP
jgi:hypothetical protein